MKTPRSIFILMPVAVLLGGCATQQGRDEGIGSEGLRHLGSHTYKVTTKSKEAQRAFDRGLTLSYSFSHYAAEQEFRKATEADPNCAMAWWGIALVNGPHINFPAVPPDHAAKAWQALTNAQALAIQATPVEQALIAALGKRYANPQPEDRSALDNAYAEAMRTIWKENPNDADVGTLFAEAAMDLHPWDMFIRDKPQPWTSEILATLEAAMRIDEKHPGANHLYIHAIEASPTPEKGVPPADRLAKLVPDASHMVHMPSHIYARVSRWDDAAKANRAAMVADANYRSAYPRPGFYAMYMAHNAHFLAFVSMMQGRKEESFICAQRVVNGIPEEFIQNFGPVVDGYMIFESEALLRFGRWEEILSQPAPPAGLPLSKALWHFARTSALTALERTEEAGAERVLFEKARGEVPADAHFGNNSSTNLLGIASLVLEGEMDARADKLEAARKALQQATSIEDGLKYDEPPDWIQPVRHTLGAVLLKGNKAAEAEEVYREDLKRYPENGWALLGLRDALRQQGKEAEARAAEIRWKKAWKGADVKPHFTCYCQEY